MKMQWIFAMFIVYSVLGSSTTFVPELLSNMNCTCIEITKCPFVSRLLQDPVISEHFKSQHLKSITCAYKRFTPFVCCGEEVIKMGLSYDWLVSLRELLPRKCGLGSKKKSIDGRTAALGAYPWIARLGYTRIGKSRLQYHCEGSLINDRYVITAAHCVIYLPGNLTLVSIRLGEVDEQTDPDCNEHECANPVQDFSFEEIIIHSGYISPKYQKDIALIRLDKPVNISSYVSPICLPLDHSPRKNYTGQTAIVAGWGSTGIGLNSTRRSNVLEWARLKVVPLKECAPVFGLLDTVMPQDGQICAVREEGLDFCGTDNGGPLMLPEQNAAEGIPRYVLIGFVSRGMKYCGSDDSPGVYTQTSAYIDWIIDNIY